MQNKFIFNGVKYLFYFCSLILIISLSQTFTGCGGSDEEEVTGNREKDSLNVYTKIQKAFAAYMQALKYNESLDEKNANKNFESALKDLNEINYELIIKPENYNWKKDYEELAKSIVEDYFTTQSSIDENSLVFDFSKRVKVEYEKIEQYSGDREPLPDGSDVPLVRNSAVEEYIEFFSKTDRGRGFIDKCLYRSGKYFPIMRKLLKYNNAPEELIYLSVQESGLAPTIVSRAGAVGLWQFMPATGYAYGLSQDGYHDDRRDFEKSTDAAARHLKDLYRTYDDWYLAFAAYNAGPGRVNKAISRGGSEDFWSIRGYLPGETKNYVPSILALSFILRNPGEYGFNDIEYGEQLSFDRVNVKASLTLQKVAELCESDIETIRELNPEITNDELPLYDVSYQLRIPHQSFNKFASNYEKASDIDKSNSTSPEFVGDEKAVGKNLASVGYKVKYYEPGDISTIGSTTGKTKVTHYFKREDMLSVVSIHYSVRPTDIRIWNNISYGTYPTPNQNLDIYLSEEKFRLLYGKNEEPKLDVTEEIKKDVNVLDTTSMTSSDIPNENPETNITESNEQVNTQTEAPETNNETVQKDYNKSTEEIKNNREDVEYIEEDNEYVAEDPNVKVENKKQTSSKKEKLSLYTVEEGDYLSSIAAKFGVSVSNLMEWNNLESDKIFAGQKLKLRSASSKTSIHIVSEGEYLTGIAKEYGVKLTDLMEWNSLDNDIIFAGQKLKVVQPEKMETKKSSASKKTHKVKNGETLASIADDYNISIQNLKEWNKLKTDKILIGQSLKLYDDNIKQKKGKVRKRKN